MNAHAGTLRTHHRPWSRIKTDNSQEAARRKASIQCTEDTEDEEGKEGPLTTKKVRFQEIQRTMGQEVPISNTCHICQKNLSTPGPLLAINSQMAARMETIKDIGGDLCYYKDQVNIVRLQPNHGRGCYLHLTCTYLMKASADPEPRQLTKEHAIALPPSNKDQHKNKTCPVCLLNLYSEGPTDSWDNWERRDRIRKSRERGDYVQIKPLDGEEDKGNHHLTRTQIEHRSRDNPLEPQTWEAYVHTQCLKYYNKEQQKVEEKLREQQKRVTQELVGEPLNQTPERAAEPEPREEQGDPHRHTPPEFRCFIPIQIKLGKKAKITLTRQALYDTGSTSSSISQDLLEGLEKMDDPLTRIPIPPCQWTTPGSVESTEAVRINFKTPTGLHRKGFMLLIRKEGESGLRLGIDARLDIQKEITASTEIQTRTKKRQETPDPPPLVGVASTNMHKMEESPIAYDLDLDDGELQDCPVCGNDLAEFGPEEVNEQIQQQIKKRQCRGGVIQYHDQPGKATFHPETMEHSSVKELAEMIHSSCAYLLKTYPDQRPFTKEHPILLTQHGSPHRGITERCPICTRHLYAQQPTMCTLKCDPKLKDKQKEWTRGKGQLRIRTYIEGPPGVDTPYHLVQIEEYRPGYQPWKTYAHPNCFKHEQKTRWDMEQKRMAFARTHHQNMTPQGSRLEEKTTQRVLCLSIKEKENICSICKIHTKDRGIPDATREDIANQIRLKRMMGGFIEYYTKPRADIALFYPMEGPREAIHATCAYLMVTFRLKKQLFMEDPRDSGHPYDKVTTCLICQHHLYAQGPRTEKQRWDEVDFFGEKRKITRHPSTNPETDTPPQGGPYHLCKATMEHIEDGKPQHSHNILVHEGCLQYVEAQQKEEIQETGETVQIAMNAAMVQPAMTQPGKQVKPSKPSRPDKASKTWQTGGDIHMKIRTILENRKNISLGDMNEEINQARLAKLNALLRMEEWNQRLETKETVLFEKTQCPFCEKSHYQPWCQPNFDCHHRFQTLEEYRKKNPRHTEKPIVPHTLEFCYPCGMRHQRYDKTKAQRKNDEIFLAHRPGEHEMQHRQQLKTRYSFPGYVQGYVHQTNKEQENPTTTKEQPWIWCPFCDKNHAGPPCQIRYGCSKEGKGTETLLQYTMRTGATRTSETIPINMQLKCKACNQRHAFPVTDGRIKPRIMARQQGDRNLSQYPAPRLPTPRFPTSIPQTVIFNPTQAGGRNQQNRQPRRNLPPFSQNTKYIRTQFQYLPAPPPQAMQPKATYAAMAGRKGNKKGPQNNPFISLGRIQSRPVNPKGKENKHAVGSWAKMASKIESEIWSATLSG